MVVREYVTDLAPGTALYVGCGEGADVVWLAERGWRVTGVDASAEALAQARRCAGEAGVLDRTTFVAAGGDLPGGNDLVVAAVEHDAGLYAAVRPGGTLLVGGAPAAGALGPEWSVVLATEAVVVARREPT